MKLKQLLGSTRPPAEPGQLYRSNARRDEGCRPTTASDLYAHTPHTAHLALLVSLASGAVVGDMK
jgi:hypothetical protein